MPKQHQPHQQQQRRQQPWQQPQVIAVTVAALVSLALGFQLARWTATNPAASTPEAVSPHAHAVQAAPGAEVGGLSISAGGYTLVPHGTVFAPRRSGTLRFRITGPDGKAVTDYAVVQEKQLHLVVARRDLTGYQHLHPTMTPDGVWSTPLTLSTPGVWRAFADFAVVGANGSQIAMALGADLTVSGDYSPEALPPPAREATVGGYTVTFEGTPRPAATLPLVFRVYRGGALISSLEPYLGALGHLVVLRAGDAGYLHVHSDPPTSAADTRFWITAPSAGRYRMFLDFKMGGAVHTAEFTVEVA